MVFFQTILYVILKALIATGKIIDLVIKTFILIALFPAKLLSQFLEKVKDSVVILQGKIKNRVEAKREYKKLNTIGLDFPINSFLRKIKGYDEKFSRWIFDLKIPKLRLNKFNYKTLNVKKKNKKTIKNTQAVTYVASKTNFWQKVKYSILGMVLAFFFLFLPIVLYLFIADLPTLSKLSVKTIAQTTKILDRNGNLLFEIYSSENRTVVPLKDIPRHVQLATIAIEDKDFYNHPGFDIRGILRALYVNTKEGQLQGGSTITQQLIKSALLTPETTIIRKVKEIVLAFWAERQYSKDEILALYFNYVPYGGTSWGIQAASKTYFGKDISEVNLAEGAFLAGLPRAPSVYSPFVNENNRWKDRQKEVLQAMVRDGYISQEDADLAFRQEIKFLSPKVPITAPHFVMYVKNQLIDKYGLFAVEQGGLVVKTSLDSNLQKIAEDAVRLEVENSTSLGIGNGAALITDPSNGDILAMVGSKDYFDLENDGNVNLTTSLRQPGSTIKLVTYALALSNGYTEASILDDSPLTIHYEGGPSYTPVNYDGRFHGRIPLRLALANSYNIPAVRLAQRLGVDSIIEMGQKMGIESWNEPDRYGVSITLGGAEVSMMELATVYGTVANSGAKVKLNPILEVKNSDGMILETKTVTYERVLSDGVAFILSDILSDNRARSLAFGSNSPLNIPGKRVSVKTGTTDNKRDNWTVGFTDDYLVAVWVGNNDNTPLSQAFASGITGAAPIWNSIMSQVIYDDEEEKIVPDSVVEKNCFGYNAYFVRGSENLASCTYMTPTPTFQIQ